MSSGGKEEGGANHNDAPTNSTQLALPCPDLSNVTLSHHQPRQPTSLQDLLRFSVEASGGQVNPSNGLPLDEERRKFLEEALKGLTVDVIEELLKAINILKRAGTLELQDDPTECEQALEHITDFVDNLDTANDFYKIGGFCIFQPCLDSAHSSLRWRAAEIIADLTQNNPYCQQHILEADLLPVLLSLADSDPVDQVRIKALYAISCLVRQNRKAQEEFSKHKGYSVLLRSMQSNVEKLKIKSAFLLSCLCSSSEVKDELFNMGFVEQLVALVTPDESPALEPILSALVALMVDHEPSQRECCRPELHLRDKLTYLISQLSAKEECREICEYAGTLMETLFSGDVEEER